jgi:alpha-N-arabinofuranosidase
MKALITALVVVLTACPAYAAIYHVSPTGLDGNSGTETQPFKTISAAASVAEPGDTITVHEGVYRERVNPPRGGSSDDQRIKHERSQSKVPE